MDKEEQTSTDERVVVIIGGSHIGRTAKLIQTLAENGITVTDDASRTLTIEERFGKLSVCEMYVPKEEVPRHGPQKRHGPQRKPDPRWATGIKNIKKAKQKGWR